MSNAKTSLQAAWGGLLEVSDALSRAHSLVDLLHTLSTAPGREAAEYGGLDEASVTSALWMAEQNITTGLERVNSLLGTIEREREQEGGEHE